MLEREPKTENYKVIIRFKKCYVLVDHFEKRPAREECVELLIEALRQHELDDDLEIKVTPVTSRRIDSPMI